MQLFSIENLSFAAEATGILLLLSFAWPRKAIEPLQETSEEKTISWEPAKLYFLRLSVFRGLYLKVFRENQENAWATRGPSAPYAPPEIEGEPEKPSIPTPWQDRLTRLLNRHGFDAVLKEWMSISENQRGHSCLSMINVATYSDLVITHGAMGTEQAIQRIASQLSLSLATQAMIARYLPDRFVVLHFASQLADCHQEMEAVEKSIAEVGFFKVAGEPFPLPCLISIVALGSNFAANTNIDELDEGVIEAQQSGRTIVSRVDEHWTDSPPASVLPKPLGKPEIPVSLAENHPNANEEVNVSKLNQLAPEHDPQSSSNETCGDPSEGNNLSEPSNDISAVANADDIAALFAQINSNKASKSSENQKQADQNTAAPAPVATPAPVAPPAPTVEVDPAEAATADDIAALFASMKPSSPVAPLAAAPTVAPVAPVAPAADAAPAPANAGPKSKDEKPDVDVTEAATADDIAAIFATVKSGLKTIPSVESESVKPDAMVASAEQVLAVLSSDKSTEAAAAPSLPSGEQLNEAASADDIAALFASMKK